MGLFGFLFAVFVGANTANLAIYDPQMDSTHFAQLKDLIEQKSFENPEAFLTDWKTARPEYFSNYVLAYRSRSLQQSSWTHPRALLFNKNADLIITFNGHANHKGFNNLELVHFNHDTKTFEFHEISFDQRRAKLSDANPKKCLACHQSGSRGDVNPRPNWEPYNTWPGFYGGLDDKTDLFLSGAKRDLDPIADAVILEEFENETARLKEFRYSWQMTNPRYSLLTAVTTNQYNNEVTLNGDLTNRLAVLNFKRVAKLIHSLRTEIYEMTKWTVWAHARCGSTLYMEQDVYDWLYTQVPNKDLERRTQRRPDQSGLIGVGQFGEDAKFLKATPYVPPRYKTVDTSDVINVLFEAAGVRTDDWSMDFKTDGGRFAAFERFGVTSDPRPPWSEAIKRELSQDPELQVLDCKKAEQKSLERFSNLKQVQEVYARLRAGNPVIEAKPLIARCLNCHSTARGGDDITPVIPFDDPRQLKLALQKTGYKRGTLLDEIRFRVGPHATEDEQMPKGGVPSSQQVDELLEYLTSL